MGTGRDRENGAPFFVGYGVGQRNSGYERQERDSYPTPRWVTEALLPHVPG